MLVGEYGVKLGGSALTIPFHNFHAMVRETGNIPPDLQKDARYVETPLYFREDGTMEKVDFNPSQIPFGYRFFLLDSGERFDTEPLVKQFLKQMEDSGFASSIRNEYLPLNQKLIESLLGHREADPAMLVRVISDFQFTHFRKMIPDKMIDVWIEGQISNEYYLKLHGSDGGFMLGITHHTSMENLTERWKKNLIWV